MRLRRDGKVSQRKTSWAARSVINVKGGDLPTVNMPSFARYSSSLSAERMRLRCDTSHPVRPVRLVFQVGLLCSAFPCLAWLGSSPPCLALAPIPQVEQLHSARCWHCAVSQPGLLAVLPFLPSLSSQFELGALGRARPAQPGGYCKQRAPSLFTLFFSASA